MSFQPFPFTWYASIPRTIAADCDAVYLFEPAVWWTTAKPRLVAYDGAPLRILSSAPHDGRVMIDGEPAIARLRGGRPSEGLSTK
jgi:hypothetical protein